MSNGRFSYAISEAAERVIHDKMNRFSVTKNSAINSLIEEIPRNEGQIQRLYEQVKGLEAEKRNLEALLESEREQNRNEASKIRAMREVFGLDRIDALVVELNKVLKSKPGKKETEPAG